MLSRIHEELQLDRVLPADPFCVAVENEHDLKRLCEDVLGERDYPIVGLTERPDSVEPVLRPSDIRSVVEEDVRIYLITDEHLLGSLAAAVGSRLRLDRGCMRIWWPGAARDSSSADHPVVVALEGEDYLDTLAEFTLEFSLSRPGVRERVKLIEDARAFLEHEVARSVEESRHIAERLRDAKIECHELRMRAEAAEAALAALPAPGARSD
jgi:hypothetical protein